MDTYDIARNRAQQIRASLDDPEVDTGALIKQAHAAKDWDAQGYDDWETYVEQEFRLDEAAPHKALTPALRKTGIDPLTAASILGLDVPGATTQKERNRMARKKLGKYQVARPLTAEEMKALEASIKENGILEPIVLDEDGNIIDGHHRQAIADKLGLTDVPTRQLEGLDEDQKVAAAKELNYNRRQLGAEERRQLIVDELVADPKVSNRAIARVVGASEGTVRNVRKELESSAQITQSDTSVGKDGVERKKPEPRPKPEPMDVGDISSVDEDDNEYPEDTVTFSSAEGEQAETAVLSALGALNEAVRQIDKAAALLGDGEAERYNLSTAKELISAITSAIEGAVAE